MSNRRRESILIPVLDKKGKPIPGQFQEFFPPGSQKDKYAKKKKNKNRKSISINV